MWHRLGLFEAEKVHRDWVFFEGFWLLCVDPYTYSQAEIIHTPGKFGLKVTLIQPASFFLLEMTQTSPKK